MNIAPILIFWAHNHFEHNWIQHYVWWEVLQACFFSSNVFDRLVNGKSYEDMLWQWLYLQFTAVGITGTVVLQHDKPLLSEFKNAQMNCFQQMNWAGIGGSRALLVLPPRSPDLSTPDNVLWGFIKDKINQQHYWAWPKLQAAMTDAFRSITDFLGKHGIVFSCVMITIMFLLIFYTHNVQYKLWYKENDNICCTYEVNDV